MQFQETSFYPQSAETLLRVFSNSAYFVDKYARAGARDIRVLEAVETDGGSRITVSREVDVEVPVPAFARKHVPHTITLVQTDSWDYPSRSGHLEIRFRGMPAQINCAMRLEEQDRGTLLVLNFTVRVQVPFVGTRLAELLARDLRSKFERDSAAAHQAMAAVLAGPA